MASNMLAEIEQQPLGEFTEKAYLNYSMYVILDRALPHLADGLKASTKAHHLRNVGIGFKSGSKI